MACSKTKEGEIAHRACYVGDVDLSLKNNFGVFFLNVFTTESRRARRRFLGNRR
jgi:hypothetical protein